MKKMNKKFLIVFCLCLMGGIQNAMGQTYVLNDGTERNFSTISSYTYDLDGRPAGTLTFDAKCVPISVFYGGDLKVAQYINGSWSAAIFSQKPPKNSYQSYGPITLDRKATKVKFYTETGATGKKYFKNVKVTMATYVERTPSSLTFNTTVETPTTQTFTVNHCNVAALTVSSNNSVFTPLTTSVPSAVGTYGSTTVTIQYSSVTTGTHTGTITISNGSQSTTVSVSGTATKKTQTIQWKENIDVIPVGENVENAATATSGLAVSLSSSASDIIAVENGKLVAKAAGKAIITATQAGNNLWAEVTDTKEIEATQKEVQTITWNQDLSRLKTTDAPLTLTATASSGLEVTYTSSNTSVVSVAGNILTMVGAGEAVVTAVQAGNVTYAGASCERDAKVRVPSTGCNPLVLDAGESSFATISSKEYELSGEPEFLTFDAKCVPINIVVEYWGGDLKVAQYINGSWSNALFSQKPPKNSYQSYGPIQLDRRATKIKLYTETGATGEKWFRDVQVTLAKYLESDKASVTFNTMIGALDTKTFTVNYSNIADVLELTHRNEHFIITPTDKLTLGEECGDKGSQTYTISYTPTVFQNETDTITITNGTQTLRIPINSVVTKRQQVITWTDELANIIATDEITCTATAAPSGYAISYVSSDSTVAYVNAENKLIILKAGTLTLTATQAGDSIYDPAASIVKEIVISKVTPTITTLPTATDLTYGQMLSTSVLSNGVASVAGTFAWATADSIPNAGNAQNFTVNFTPTNTNYYNATTCKVTLNVAKVTPSITTIPTASNLTYGEKLSQSTLSDGVATVEGTFAFAVADSIPNAGNAQSFTVNFTPDDTDNYKSITCEVSLNVAQATPTVTTLPTASNLTYGEKLSVSVLSDGVASVAGTFAFAVADSIPNAGNAQNFTVNFTPDDTDNYKSITCEVSLNVAKATPTVITLPTATDLTYGQSLSVSVLSNGVASVAGTFAWTVADSIPNPGYAQNFTVNFVPEDTINYNVITCEVAINVIDTPATANRDVKIIEVQIFPNPATDVLRIISEKMKTISIYDEQGRLIIRKELRGASETAINVSNWQNALYIIRIENTEEQMGTQTFIKQ